MALVALRRGQCTAPRVLTGGRACPPEDCGGPGGYADLVENIANPRPRAMPNAWTVSRTWSQVDMTRGLPYVSGQFPLRQESGAAGRLAAARSVLLELRSQ